jgi:hypothetical protein
VVGEETEDGNVEETYISEIYTIDDDMDFDLTNRIVSAVVDNTILPAVTFVGPRHKVSTHLSGILPVSLLLEMLKICKDVNFPILHGIVPFRRLAFKYK